MYVCMNCITLRSNTQTQTQTHTDSDTDTDTDTGTATHAFPSLIIVIDTSQVTKRTAKKKRLRC
jgi:hypothetical protein